MNYRFKLKLETVEEKQESDPEREEQKLGKKAGVGDREVNLIKGLGQDWEIEDLRDQKIRVCLRFGV